MKIAVLDAITLGDDIDLSCLKALGEVITYPSTAPQETAGRLRGVDCVIVNKVRIEESVLAQADRLKLVCVAATGYDNIYLDDMRAHGIAVCNVVGYSTHSVAQLTLSMVLSLAMHLPEYNRFVESGAYTNSGVANCLVPVYHELAGKTWGIVGCGNIGGQVASVARAMGCQVIVCKRTPDPRYTCVDIDTLCRQADVITIHTPLSPETENLISKERIAAMKPGAIVVNVARGAVCD
ncbi:MAG: hydroxyacid dehydrogenase, partial [Clostridiales bacterium]|nr:hydroxyacid dehydrogenase [Clostridiales bacterium]